MIDSHCHLADRKFTHDLDQVLHRAKEAGVEKCVTIADTLKESKQCVALARKYAEIFATVGVHPHAAREWTIDNEQLIIDFLKSSEKVVAIGEIGLDYYYDNSPRDVQRDVFKVQLELAKESNVPVVIHCRDAMEDLRRIIEEVDYDQLVLHCCTEQWEDVKWLVQKGAMIGFTGIATYPKAEQIREVIERCPLEQMMIETDAPYLAPDPHRGKRNEPAFVAEVAALIARLKNVSLEKVDQRTTQNTMEFYGL